MSKPILIATDGSPGSAGAITVGAAMAQRMGAKAHFLCVMPTPPQAYYGDMAAPPEAYAMMQAAAVEDLRLSVQRQLDSLVPGTAVAEVTTGTPAYTVTEAAKRLGAGLIVAGTGPRTAVERWLRSDTALRIIQLSTVPVLLVPPDQRRIPSSALVAIDFSDFSIRAARETLGLLQTPAHLMLAHVAWTPFEAEALPSAADFWKTYEIGARERLERLAEDLREESEVRIDTGVLHGDAAREIVTFATRLNVDLVAAGSHGRGFLGRLLLGSTSSGVVHGARSQVLILPPSSEAEMHPDPGTG